MLRRRPGDAEACWFPPARASSAPLLAARASSASLRSALASSASSSSASTSLLKASARARSLLTSICVASTSGPSGSIFSPVSSRASQSLSTLPRLNPRTGDTRPSLSDRATSASVRFVSSVLGDATSAIVGITSMRAAARLLPPFVPA
eukprot:scaffold30969_cov60-Phaeocystis_antarctica.AAC.5